MARKGNTHSHKKGSFYMIVLLFTIGIFCLTFGLVHPFAMIVWYKLNGSKKTIKEIVKEL